MVKSIAACFRLCDMAVSQSASALYRSRFLVRSDAIYFRKRQIDRLIEEGTARWEEQAGVGSRSRGCYTIEIVG